MCSSGYTWVRLPPCLRPAIVSDVGIEGRSSGLQAGIHRGSKARCDRIRYGSRRSVFVVPPPALRGVGLSRGGGVAPPVTFSVTLTTRPAGLFRLRDATARGLQTEQPKVCFSVRSILGRRGSGLLLAREKVVPMLARVQCKRRPAWAAARCKVSQTGFRRPCADARSQSQGGRTRGE
jgi:hypothetical protein